MRILILGTNIAQCRQWVQLNTALGRFAHGHRIETPADMIWFAVWPDDMHTYAGIAADMLIPLDGVPPEGIEHMRARIRGMYRYVKIGR